MREVLKSKRENQNLDTGEKKRGHQTNGECIVKAERVQVIQFENGIFEMVIGIANRAPSISAGFYSDSCH